METDIPMATAAEHPTKQAAPQLTEWEKKTDEQKIGECWDRYQYGVSRGHKEFTETAKMLEGMYLGGNYDKDGRLLAGGHWNATDLATLDAKGVPAHEIGGIRQAVNAALGYQIANRMDISFKPRAGEATKELADVRSKVAMQIADNNTLHWIETEVFADGLIEQRGYYDIRMSYEDSMLGECKVTSLDPLDVIPDPDANSYDPKYWSDVTVTRFMTIDQIADQWGEEAKEIAELEASGTRSEQEFGDDADGERRNTFATNDRYDSSYVTGKTKRIRVIDRQQYIRMLMDVAVYPEGDIRQINGDESPEYMEQLRQSGVEIIKKMMRRVRWTVCTVSRLLHDDWSPYDRFTVVPFFPHFRRGQTRGMVDNAVGPVKILDKAVSQALHIINTTANSGWQLEEGQLVNITAHQLATWGASTGLVLERKANTPPIEKIRPNEMPQGMANLIDLGNRFIQDCTIPDAMRGVNTPQESGLAIQSRQHAAQQILSVQLDNMARTRRMLAAWFDYAISKYYDSLRVFRITKTDPNTGKEIEERLAINEFDPETGTYNNDMTAGEYDIVISEQPMQITFENSQFQQAIEMRKEGIGIPDQTIIKHSNLADKGEIISIMETAAAGAQESDPMVDAKVKEIMAKIDLIVAQKAKVENETANVGVDAMYSAAQAAGVLATNPSLAPVAEELVLSAGFVDRNKAPMIPSVPMATGGGMENMQPIQPGQQQSASENMVANIPDTSGPDGAHAGIETQRIEGAM